MSTLPEPTKPPYGTANPRRGVHVTEAVAFITAFPLGTLLNPAQFDVWAHAAGHLAVPEAGVSKQSDAWKAHLQRRHELRHRINLAGAHPRLTQYGATPFIIEALFVGQWKVQAPQVAIAESRMGSRVTSLIRTKKRQLGYLLQSADFSMLPPYEKMFAESLYDDIDAFSQRVALDSNGLNTKFRKLQAKLRQAIESGEVVPRNSGLAALLAPEQGELEEGFLPSEDE